MKPVRDLRDSEVRLARLAAATLPSGGSVHPSDLAARISGESDLACRPGLSGPVAPNRFSLHLNRTDLKALGNPRPLGRELELATEAVSMARGRRLEGPVRIRMEADPALDEGVVLVRSFRRAGRRPPWAFMTGGGPVLELTVNRAVVGRSGKADLVIPHESVSRRHAVVWFEGDGVWVRDMGSSTGTFVDGRRTSGTTGVRPGATVGFGEVTYELSVV